MVIYNKDLNFEMTFFKKKGMILNQLSSIKYHSWGKENPKFFPTVKAMWSEGGLRPFFKGIWATTVREIVFGCSYEVFRWQFYRGLAWLQGIEFHNVNPNTLRPTEKQKKASKEFKTSYFIGNMMAAGTATILSGPFNYVRNIKYSIPPHTRPPSTYQCLKDLLIETKTQPTRKEALKFLQAQLRLGWGTVRVVTIDLFFLVQYQ